MAATATQIVVDEDFVLRIPASLDPAGAAPLLCAGITTYSPLRHVGVSKGTRVAVMGLGGLGHMGVKLAASFGAEVTVLSHSPSKAADAQRLGAHDFVLTSGTDALAPLAGRFDVILDTVSAEHDVNAYINCLKTGRHPDHGGRFADPVSGGRVPAHLRAPALHGISRRRAARDARDARSLRETRDHQRYREDRPRHRSTRPTIGRFGSGEVQVRDRLHEVLTPVSIQSLGVGWTGGVL